MEEKINKFKKYYEEIRGLKIYDKVKEHANRIMQEKREHQQHGRREDKVEVQLPF